MNPNNMRPTDDLVLDAVRELGGNPVRYAPGEKEEALREEQRALSGGKYRPRRVGRRTLEDRLYGPLPVKK